MKYDISKLVRNIKEVEARIKAKQYPVKIPQGTGVKYIWYEQDQKLATILYSIRAHLRGRLHIRAHLRGRLHIRTQQELQWRAEGEHDFAKRFDRAADAAAWGRHVIVIKTMADQAKLIEQHIQAYEIHEIPKAQEQ